MKDKVKATRREKALVTRRRMLRAAYELFCEHGYTATTMELIAERAEVAVQTLYFTFQNKAKVLNECVGAAIVGFDRWDPRAEPAIVADPRQAFMDFHPWFPAFERAKTPREALLVFTDASVDIFERVSPLVLVMTAAGQSDPELKAYGDIGEQRRVEGYQLVVEMLAARGGLRRGLSVERGTDILLAVLSAETHMHLALRRRWSREDCRDWYVDVLAQQLLPAEPR